MAAGLAKIYIHVHIYSYMGNSLRIAKCRDNRLG